jgi:hypothetical protein
VLPTVEALGERPVRRVWRTLAVLAAGVDVRWADGRAPLDALREGWRAGRAGSHRERARQGMRRRALRGHVLGRPPYGYAVEDRALVPHPAEAPVVRRMFERYLDEHLGVRRIAALLNAEGVRTRRGGTWTAGSVRAVLRNPVYTGLYRRLGVAVPGSHPPLIPRARFEEAMSRMAGRRTAPSAQRRQPYLLSGLLRCGACGARMIGARRPGEGPEGGEHRYYRCASRTNEGRCAFGTWRAGDLEAEVRRILAAPGRLPVAARPEAPPDPEARRGRLERGLATMLDRWSAGEWTDAAFLRRARAPVEALAALEAPSAPSPAPEEARARLVARWDALDAAERHVLLAATVAEVTVGEREVSVVLRR